MKYIRTKDGKIYKVLQGVFGERPVDKEGNVLRMPFAIKQADTIEELCDGWDFFDSIYNEYKTKGISFYTLNNMKVSIERKDVRDVKLYIRTDKGLIYVAKMNEKGELELL